MKTKKEIIKSVLGDIAQYADENGWCKFIPLGFSIKDCDCKDRNKYRPKSLAGIETNNGWIRIESEDDLPKKENALWIRYEDGSTILGRYNIFTNKFVTSHGKMFDDDKPTHFKYIDKTLPPLY